MAVHKGRTPGTQRVRIWMRGKQHEWIVEGSKTEARAFEARKRVELEAGLPLETRVVPTFSDFCVSRYRAHATAQLRSSTWSVRKYQLATLGGSFLGNLRLTEFSTDAIERYKQARRREVQPRSVNNELKVLLAVFAYARELGVPVGTFKCKPLPVIGRGRAAGWNDVQLSYFWQACRENAPKMIGVCLFLANTGCRAGEAIHAEWEWIDRKPGYVSIQPNAHWQPKSNEPREIPIPEALAPWLSGERKHARWVFVSRKNRPYAGWPKKQFARVVDIASRAMCREGCPGRKDKAKCKHWCPSLRGGAHTLRHTFASHFLRGMPDMYLLAQILGHSHERVTELYAHLLPDHLERARNVVNMTPGVGPAALEANDRWRAKRPSRRSAR